MSEQVQINEYEIVNKYKKIMIRMLKYSYPYLSVNELNEAVDYSIQKRFKNSDAKIINNYKKKEINTTLAEMTDYIIKREPIITAYGVMFKRHGEEPNPMANLLKSFMEGRNVYKAEMFKHPKGSDQYEKYNLLQALAKID